MLIKQSEYLKSFSNHLLASEKQVILGKNVIPHLLQVAVGFLKKDQFIESHSHDTMNEFFYLIDGKLQIEIENVIFVIENNDSILIGKKKKHSLLAIENSKFLYFNIENV